MRDQGLQHLAVDQGHDLVLVPHHDQHVLFQEGQGGHAGPAQHAQQLIHVTARGGRGETADVFVLAPGQPAVKRAEMLFHEGRVDIAARVGHLGQGGGLARNHDHAGAGRGQGQAAHHVAVLQGKVLRHGAAPRNAHDVDLFDIEAFEQLLCRPAHGEGVVGDNRFRAAADARHVEHDEGPFGQGLGQRGHGLDIRADAVEEQDRQVLARLVPAPPRDAQRPAADGFHREFGGQIKAHFRQFLRTVRERRGPEPVPSAGAACCPGPVVPALSLPTSFAAIPSRTATSFLPVPLLP